MKLRSKSRLIIQTKPLLNKKGIIGLSILVVAIISCYLFFSGGHIERAKAASVANSKDEYTGSWMNSASWEGNKIPAPSDELVINGKITRNGSLAINDGGSLTISTGDTLIIMGNLQLGSESAMKVMTNGVLIVKGNYKSMSSSKDEVQAGGAIQVSGILSFIGVEANLVVEPGATFSYDSQINPSVAKNITGGGTIVSF